MYILPTPTQPTDTIHPLSICFELQKSSGRNSFLFSEFEHLPIPSYGGRGSGKEAIRASLGSFGLSSITIAILFPSVLIALLLGRRIQSTVPYI